MIEYYKSYQHDRPLLERLRDHHNLNTPHSNAMQEAAGEIERLRAENEKLREELEEMREACQANYMLGIERGKEEAINIAAAMRESGDE